jgi:hypothetical protein
MMDGSDTRASNLKTGKTKNANPRNARSLEHALMTYWGKPKQTKTRLDPQDIHARLILMIGATLALTFLLVTVGVVYALIFVTQPIGAQAPNDAAFIDLVSTLTVFLTGTLAGIVSANGLKSKKKDDELK